MRKSVSFQPIGRQPPKDTANQHQGRHAPLFSYQTTRDARIKFWDFGRTRILVAAAVGTGMQCLTEYTMLQIKLHTFWRCPTYVKHLNFCTKF